MIDPKYYGLIELVLFGALAIGFGVWQLRGLKKLEREREREQEAGRREDKE